MVTIATFNEPAKAKALKERLGKAGIRADVHNEGHLQQVAFMSRPQANNHVQVENALIRCPQCRSSRIEYPQLTRKFITPALASVLFALRLFPKEFYCQDCHYTWSNEDQPTFARLWHRFFPGAEPGKETS
jgi:hypothetical protein